MSVLAEPGPLRICWPLLPNVPCRGWINAAVLNHLTRLWVKPLRGSPTCWALSSPESEQLQTSPDACTENGNPPRREVMELVIQFPSILLSGPVVKTDLPGPAGTSQVT